MIAAVSTLNNAARRLTGLLIHGGSRFFAVLEGPPRHVFARMEAIIIDPRHQALRIIREEPIVAQRFANWSFGRIPDEVRKADADGLESFILGLASRL